MDTEVGAGMYRVFFSVCCISLYKEVYVCVCVWTVHNRNLRTSKPDVNKARLFHTVWI